MSEVDTAALAVHLRCTPGYVRLMVSRGLFKPCGTRRVSKRGRPANVFDLDEVDAAIREALATGRVELDQGQIRMRK